MDIDVSKFRHRVDNFKAGTISRCYGNWRKITASRWILDLVQGYSIEFKDEPFQLYRPKPLRLNEQSQQLLDEALEEFLHLELLSRVILMNMVFLLYFL